jgi:hypothetical protein
MANAMNRSPANRRIDIYDPDEVSFWCREFDIMPVELISAVITVGPRVDDVKAELGHIP